MKEGQPVREQRASVPGTQTDAAAIAFTGGTETVRRRKGLIEPVFGTLKEHRGMRRFYRRGLAGVNTEFLLMALAFNLTRVHGMQQKR